MSLKRLFLLLLLPSLASATKIVSQQAGNWGTSATWVGGTIPGNGDEISLFHVVQATDTRTVGVSVSTGSFAINLNSTGTLRITGSGHIVQRGYGTYTSGAGNTNDAVIVDSGTAWEFDMSATTSPHTIHYSFYPSGSAGYRKFKISGSSTAYASLYANLSSTTGVLSQNGQTDGGVYELYYASVTNMAFDIAYNGGASVAPTKWDATFSSFTSCSVIDFTGGGNLPTAGTFKHEFNSHIGTRGLNVFNFNFYTFKDPTGIRSIKNNVIDAQLGATIGLGDFTIQNNYLGSEYGAYFSSWSLFTNNFIRIMQPDIATLAGTTVDSYFWWNEDRQNPHVAAMSISSSIALSGIVWGQSGKSNNIPGADDSGEFWLQAGPGNISTTSIKTSIFLPNSAGYSSLEITSLLGTASAATYLNNRFVCEHNTWFGGWDNSNSALPPFAAVDFSETSNMGPGTLDSFRSNLLWNPLVSTQPAQYFKVLDVGNVSSNLATGYGVGPTQDVCSPARCDYNGAYVALSTATGANTASYTNQGNGYAGKFSSTPGTHDVNGQNPSFIDYKRYFEKFDSAYYRPYRGIAQPAGWSSGATYAQGDVVSHSTGTYYWGDTLNYVYSSSGSCPAGTPNPEPGAYPHSSWDRCWIFASINDFKFAILSSMTFTDSSIGASNSDINQTLLKWIRQGYSPTNAAYHATAHDGGDIGAVTVGNPGNPSITPSTAVITVGGTIQFTSTNAVTWSLTSGSAGSISASGLYTAPTTYFTAKNISPAGCPFRPNDDIINTRIDALPVDSSSTFRFAHEFTVNGGSNAITFEPTMPTNIYNPSTTQQTMNFRYTTRMNGTLFPLLSSSTRMEENSSISNNPTNDFQDHHILGVDSTTCMASEQYGYYPVGLNNPSPTSNSESGFQYYTNSYFLPDRAGSVAGGTDAAGMAIQPLLLRFSELKSGKINHALRFTLNNANIYTPSDNGWDWPATDQAFHNQCTGGSRNCFHYGARIRLKSTYNCGGFTSPGSQVVCTALQQYGGFLTDGSTTKWGISANYDLVEDTTAFRDIFTNLQSSITTSDLEQVDESSLMVSTFTGVVNPSNAYVTPSNFARAIATNVIDGSTRTVNIAIQPVTVGWGNPAYQGLDSGINVMAGTPQFQIPYWVNGATDTTATCSMTPTIGTLSSDCKYTAPTSQYNLVRVTTVTITSNIDPNHAASSFFLTIFSSDAIRVREGPATSGLDTIPPYNSNGDYQDATTGNISFEEPPNMFPNWNERSTQGSALWPSQLYNNYSRGAGDKVFSAMVPAGTYQLQMNSGIGTCCGDVAASSNSIETQGLIFQSTVTLAPAIFTAKIISTNLTVGANRAFYWAIRGNVASNHNLLSSWSLVPVATLPIKEYLQGVIKIQGKVKFQ